MQGLDDPQNVVFFKFKFFESEFEFEFDISFRPNSSDCPYNVFVNELPCFSSYKSSFIELEVESRFNIFVIFDTLVNLLHFCGEKELN